MKIKQGFWFLSLIVLVIGINAFFLVHSASAQSQRPVYDPPTLTEQCGPIDSNIGSMGLQELIDYDNRRSACRQNHEDTLADYRNAFIEELNAFKKHVKLEAEGLVEDYFYKDYKPESLKIVEKLDKTMNDLWGRKKSVDSLINDSKDKWKNLHNQTAKDVKKLGKMVHKSEITSAIFQDSMDRIIKHHQRMINDLDMVTEKIYKFEVTPYQSRRLLESASSRYARNNWSSGNQNSLSDSSDYKKYLADLPEVPEDVEVDNWDRASDEGRRRAGEWFQYHSDYEQYMKSVNPYDPYAYRPSFQEYVKFREESLQESYNSAFSSESSNTNPSGNVYVPPGMRSNMNFPQTGGTYNRGSGSYSGGSHSGGGVQDAATGGPG